MNKEKVFYQNLKEFFDEWKYSKSELSIWDYYGISRTHYEQWAKKCKEGLMDT